MTTGISRTASLLAALSASTLLLTGCGSGPSQSGAAAIVGQTVIPLESLQHRLETVLQRDAGAQQELKQHKLGNTSRNILQDQILNELIQQVARSEHLTVSEEQIAQIVDQAGGPEAGSQGSIQDPSTYRDLVRNQLLLVELGRRYLNRLSVTIDYTLTADRATALAKARELAAHPDKAKEILEADRRTGAQAGTGQKVAAAESPQLAATAMFGVKPGTVVAFQPQESAGGWLVALVRERGTAGQDGAAQQPGQEGNPRQLALIGVRMLAPLADELGVKINPRYGVWDPVLMGVAPTADEVKGYQLPARNPRSW